MTRPPDSLLTRYVTGKCTNDEKKQVEDWYDSFADNPGLFADYPHTQDAAYQETLFRKIQEDIGEREVKVIPLRSSRTLWQYAVAASLAATVLLAGFWWQQQSPADVSPSLVNVFAPANESAARTIEVVNTKAQVIRCVLPDGSVVMLNPQARISYPRQFVGSTRIVSFTGEGFFSVYRDPAHPFVIHSGQMTTEVLGTTFNVKANPGNQHYEVAVVTGKVAVQIQPNSRQTGRSQRVILEPRQQAVVNVVSAQITTLTTNVSDKRATYESVSLSFDWVPLGEVARRLEAVYAVQIDFSSPALKNCRLRADFTNQPLSAILDIISKSLSASYAMEDDAITITGAGCPAE